MSGKNSSVFFLLSTYTLHLLLTTSFAANSDNEILYDIYPFIRVYRNGTIQRFIGQGFLPASTDPRTGVQSKDVSIAKDLNVSARIYLPKNAHPGHKIPLLIYYHGGGFFTESAFSPTYHNHMNSLVAKANIVAVSVNYRLAPEHPLPIAYQDSWLALKWVFHHSSGKGGQPWLTKYADFRRVYLGGDSAGGNIAHNMAIRVGLLVSDPDIKVKGMFLNCPGFWGKRRVGNESADSNRVKLSEAIWLHAYPNITGLDDPLVNPGMDPGLKTLGCRRVLVYVGGNDGLRFRGWYYMQVLKRSGWDGIVKVVEVKGEGHVFNLNNPTTPKAIAMLKALASFINQ
ncbi:2-hydroxyisoflavanone dehydratase-like [Dorcoceras hygrometricum]|uniref:2-hydroxyisoflavanone dehydratase-like n=1 Tax=Dorcoceras hygrometricum TaxID=472368 RepID=A0A2Z7C5G3_9LAMI|nr:2-hydroxyisoflavanone dehydratase-like [Dorcoceras hygrometricum]